MKKIETLLVKYHQANVGTLSLSVDNKLCAFEYDKQWLADGFSISPLELPLKPGVFLAKPTPFGGDFGSPEKTCGLCVDFCQSKQKEFLVYDAT